MRSHISYRAGLIAVITLVIGISVGQINTVHAQGPYFQVDMNKKFNPIAIPAGGTSTLSVSIYNPNTFPLILSSSPAAWTDTLPAGVGFANPLNVTTTCGGTVTTSGNVLSVSGGTVPAQVGTVQGSCAVTVDVTSTVTGNHINTIPAGTLKATDPSGTINITSASDASATLNVNAVQPPSLNKGFAPNTMWVGQISTLTITLRNNDSNYSLTNVSITDNLPANVTVASAPAPSQCNGGTVSYTSTSISLSGGSIAKSSSCSLVVVVTSTVPGVYTNNIPAGAIQTQQGVTNASAASASLNVQSIGIAKAFSPSNFQQGGSATLTITLKNPTSSAYTGATVTDTLPAGLTVAASPAPSTTCGSGTVTSTSSSVSLSGGTIPAGSVLTPGTCTITATVTSSTPASYTNKIPSGALTTTQGATNVLAATANITVYATGLGVTGSKSFSPPTIAVGGISTLTLNLTAPADTQLTNFAVSDALPAGVQVANLPSASQNANCVGGTFSPAAGDTLLTYSGGTIPAGKTCTLKVNVTSNTPGAYTNTISPANILDDQNRSLSGNIATDLTVSGLTISKAFYPPKINPTGISTLTITLDNTNTSQLDSVSLTDDLPSGVTIADSPNASTTCNGDPTLNLTADRGTSTIQLINGIIPAQVGSVPGTCTINVDVTGTTAGTYDNGISTTSVSGTIHNTTTVIHPPSPAAATLKIAPLTIQVVKAFDPLTVYGGSASMLSIQLINPNNVPLTGIMFTDNLPQGTGADAGRGVMIANPPNPSVGTCGGTISAAPGNTSFSFSGGSLAANASCTLTVSTTMNVDNNLINTIGAGAVTTANGATNTQDASATLTNLPGASLSKVFGPNPILAGSGNSSTLTITIQNLSNFPIDGVGLIDTLPSGLTVASPPASSQCGGTVTSTSDSITLTGGSLADSTTCDIVVSVTAPAPGSYQNCIPKGTLKDNQNATNQEAACDTLTVNPVPQPPSIAKAFSPNPIPAGGTSALTFTITNPAANTVALTGVGFTDTFPTGMTLASVPNTSQCGGTVTSASNSVTLTGGTINPNSSCTVTVSVTAPAGSYPNTSDAVTSTNGGTGNTASATLNVIAPPSISKSFSPKSINVGDPAPILTFTITNPVVNPVALTGVGFTDSFPTGLTVATAPTSPQCGGTVTSTSTSITLTGGSISANDSCTVTVNVTANGGTYANTSGAANSTNGGTGNTASDTLTVNGPGLSLAKSTSTVGYQKSGDSINYSYLLTNTGNTTLNGNGASGEFTVTDDKATVSCPLGTTSLNAGQSVTCTATYTVQATDVTAKSVTNTATAHALSGATPVDSNQSSVTVNLEALTLKKSTTTAGYRSAGNTITYNYTITNTGNVTLYPPFTVTDDHIGSPLGTPFNCVTTPPSSLTPGANLICSSKTYAVTTGDATTGYVTNIATAAAQDSGSNTVTSNTSSVTVYQIIGPVISKAFSPSTIQVGAISTLTFTITNPSTNAVPLTGVGFTDTFPAGVVVANTPDSAQCGGTVSSTANSITLTNGTVINDSSNINNYCIVTVDVTGTTSGVKNNTTGTVTSSNGGNGNTASASLTVIAPPTISKSFSPNSILVGGTSTITFAITNPNAGAVLTGVGFTDALPSGMQVAGAPNAIVSGCNASSTPIFSPSAADASLSFSGGSIAAGGTCTVTVDVTATTAGTLNNVTGNVTSTEGGSGNFSSASLLAVAPPTISKSFSPTSIAQGSTTTLSFTITNPAANTVSLSGIAFSDTLPAGLTVADSTSTQCNGGTLTTTAATGIITLSAGSLNPGANCMINVTVTGATAGLKNNTTGNVASANGGTGNTASASVTVIAPPIISKSFSPNPIAPGGTTTLTFTLTNPNSGTTLNGIGFTDTFPTGMTRSATPATPQCGGTVSSTANSITLAGGSIASNGSCTVTINVTTSTSGTIVNTSGAVTSTEGGTGNTASAKLGVISATKTIVGTSEDSTSEVASPRPVLIGEIVHYHLVMNLPEGTTNSVAVLDNLVTGMRYLNDGTTKVAFVCNSGANCASSSDPGIGSSPVISGNSANVTPTFVLPSTDITNNGPGIGTNPFPDGNDPLFSLGTITNNDNDADAEYVVIEFNALVDNVSTNSSGGTRNNSFSVYVSGASLVTSSQSNSNRVTVVEPSIASITKSVAVIPTNAGDPITYQFQFTNNGSAPAFDINLTDVLDSTLTGPVTVSGSATGGSCGSTTPTVSGSYAAPTAVATLTCLAAGGTATIDISAVVSSTAPTGKTFSNAAGLTYTSLPGTGTPNGSGGNNTGSTTPGASGATNGERNGSDGPTGTNDYVASSNTVTTTLGTPSLLKDIDPTGTTYAIGATIPYRIQIFAPKGVTGNPTADLVDVLPNGLNYVPGSLSVNVPSGMSIGTAAPYTDANASFFNLNGQIITLTFGSITTSPASLATDRIITVTFQAQVANVIGNQSGTSFTNPTSFTYTNPNAAGTLTLNSSAPAVTVIEPDLTISKAVNSATPSYNSTLTYTLTVSHSGASNAPAYDTHITDAMPLGLTGLTNVNVTSSNPNGCATGVDASASTSTQLDLTIGTIPLGCDVTVTYDVTVSGAIGSTSTNSVLETWTSQPGSVSGERTGADGAGGALNDYAASASAPITVNSPDLRVAKDDGSTTYTPGTAITYTITVYNDGNITAPGTVTDNPPAELTNVTWSCIGSGTATCGSSGTNNINDTVSIPVGGHVTYTLNAIVASSATGNLSNTASASLNGFTDPTPDNNSATDTDTPVYVSDLSITKTDGNSAVGLGQTVIYTIVASNAGPSDATGATVIDSLPASLIHATWTCSPDTGAACTASGSGNLNDAGVNIPAGKKVTYTLTATVSSAATSDVVNTVTVTAPSNVSDANPNNNSAADADHLIGGCGSNSIHGVVFNDANDNGALDSGELVIPNVTITLYDQNNNIIATTTTTSTGSYSFSNLSPGIYTVMETNLSGYVSTTLDHVSVVMGCGTDAVVDYGDRETSATIVDPAVTKYGDPGTAHVGDTVIYTITVGNNGNADALDVVLTDTKPAFLDIVSINVSPNKNFPVVISGNTFTINFGTVTPTDFYTVTVLTKVNSLGRPPGGVNNASITTSSLNEPTFNDLASVELTIPSAPHGNGGGAYWSLLPHTGFAPGVVTSIAPEPANIYDTSSDLTIEIPALGVKTSIVGVPQSGDSWDVTWLANQVGYLDGTAFPTWSGNSVLTGHVYGANGLPGPFVNLHTLKWGDQIIIHFQGQRYIYEVRENKVISPTDMSAFKHENQPWLTLITCKDYNASTNTYAHRVEVGAVLVKVEADTSSGNSGR